MHLFFSFSYSAFPFKSPVSVHFTHRVACLIFQAEEVCDQTWLRAFGLASPSWLTTQRNLHRCSLCSWMFSPLDGSDSVYGTAVQPQLCFPHQNHEYSKMQGSSIKYHLAFQQLSWFTCLSAFEFLAAGNCLFSFYLDGLLTAQLKHRSRRTSDSEKKQLWEQGIA